MTPDLAALVAHLRKAHAPDLPMVPDRLCRDAAAAIEALAADNRRVRDYAERMDALAEERLTRAERAEARVHDMESCTADLREKFTTTTKRSEASDAAWRILCGGKQKIIEKLESDIKQLLSGPCGWNDGQQERDERAEAECDALRLDAERYRFMRKCDVEMYEKLHDECEDAFDAAIDAARKS